MLVPVSGMMILASVELSGELMQEIHQILQILQTFPNSLKCKEQTNTNNKLSKAFSVIKCGVCQVWFFTHIDKPFCPHFRKFSKHLSNFKHSYLSQMITKN